MWKQPWGYKEGFAICGGLLLTGIILQFTVGGVNWDLLALPANIILLTIYLVGIVAMYAASRKIYLFGWMSRYPAAITAMIGVVVITVSQMISTWPFVLLYAWFTTLLGMVTVRRLARFRWKDIPFVLNHLGLFIVLTGAVFGNADMERLEMTTQVSKPEWRAYDRQRQMKELPVAIELNHFTIDEYPPKLMLIDNETGKALPERRPVSLLLEDDLRKGKLLDWDIDIVRHIPEAARMATEDTLKFVEFYSMGSTYAVYIHASHTKSGVRKEGWISGGSFMFPYKAMQLDEKMSLIMPEREPRRYASEVTIYTESGKSMERVIEVNKPYKVDGWNIYQVSYDESKGRWSDISIFELVCDPWLPVVYTGLWMMIAGAVCMFITAGNRKDTTA